MIDWNRIKKYEESIKKNKAKLEIEKDFKKREILKLQIQISTINIKLTKLKED
jgi:hypothetical protein